VAKYTARGAIYPLTKLLTARLPTIRVRWLDTSIVFSPAVEKSRISIDVDSPVEIPPADLMILCEQVVQNFLGSLAIGLAVIYEAYIESLEDSSGNITQRELATPGVPLPSNLDGPPGDEVNNLLSLTQGPLGHHIGMAFDEFRLASRRPQDTAFHCFRAIECLRHYCAAKYNLSSKGQQWEKVRELAVCTRDYMQPIVARAEEIRHGEFSGIGGRERNDIVHRARMIIGNFLINEFPQRAAFLGTPGGSVQPLA
jgi:hypothetical protein